MKPLKIGAWYLIGIILLIIYAVVNLNCKAPCTESRFLQYETELWRHRLSPDKPVLLGPSFVNHLGTSRNFINLGFPGAPPHQVEKILSEYCGHSPVFYCVNVWNVIGQPAPSSNIPFSYHGRYKKILKAAFLGPSPKPYGNQLISSTIALTETKTKSEIQEAVDYLVSLHREWPNLHFLIFPFHSDFEKANEVNARFCEALINSDVPVFDLSDIGAPELYADPFHLNKQGRLKFKLAAVHLLSTMALHRQ